MTQIPLKKLQTFAAKVVKELSGNYDVDKLKMIESLNRKIRGWSNFYQFTDSVAVDFIVKDKALNWAFLMWVLFSAVRINRHLLKGSKKHGDLSSEKN